MFPHQRILFVVQVKTVRQGQPNGTLQAQQTSLGRSKAIRHSASRPGAKSAGPESALSIVFDWVLVLVTKWGMALLLERVGLVCLVDIFFTHWRQRMLNSYFLCRYFLSVN